MKKMLVHFVCLALLVIGSFSWTAPALAEQSPALAPPAPEVVVVSLAEQDLTLTAELPGRTAVYQIAEIRPQVSGIIQKRAFEEGAEVQADQLLYQIDPDTYTVAVARAAAAVARAQAELEPARLKALRYADLMRSSSISKQDNDEVQAALALARANVASAQAELDAVRIDLGRTKVVSPISGRIGRSSVTPGALVTANQALALATVQQLDPIYVDLTQSNAELLRLRRSLASGALQSTGAGNTPVHLFLEDGSTYAHVGTLQLAEASVDQSTGAITLRAVFPNPERELLPGMYVRAVIEEAVLPKALCVPQQAVTRNAQGEPLVMVVDADNVVGVRPLQLGRTVGDTWVVRSGLVAGEQVIVEGLQKIRPGMQVRIAAAAKDN